MPTIQDQVQAAAASFDDEALAALANKGLVRRARKDLETIKPVLVGPHQEFLRFEVEGCTVDLAAAPAQSKCSCPATGVCRHILAAVMFLRGAAPMRSAEGELRNEDPSAVPQPAVRTPNSGEEVLAVEDEALTKWAGKPLVRKATEALAAGFPADIEEAGPLVVRFPTWNAVCRWMPGGGLDGMVCSCHAPGPCAHRVAAVLAYQAARGRRRIATEEAALEASAGAPRTRDEVLASVGAVLREMVQLGLSRLSRAAAERLRTLAVSAHGVDLPRLERLLRALADEAALYLARDAQAASAGLLGTASRTLALCHALARPTPALVGQHRSHYERVGDLELVGMGARQWRTRSGYTGLTVYFWDRAARGWATWTEARPEGVGGFDPAARYTQDGPWSGCTSPEEASRTALRLLNSWRNRAGRLSARPATRALVIGPAQPLQVPGTVGRWADLASRAVRLFGGGLQGRGEMDDLVVLTPHAWGPAQYDPVRQELARPVLDDQGRAVPLVLPHTPHTAGAVESLERHDPSATRGLLGMLRLHAGRLAVEPIALYEEKKVFNITLDGSAGSVTAPVTPAAGVGEEEEPSEVEEEEVHTGTALGLLLTRASERLEALGEAGLRSAPETEVLRRLASQTDSLGLAACARPLSRLAEQLDRVRNSLQPDAAAAAETLLRAYYVVRFAATQEAVAAATSALA
jgi:hypothetical protein